MIAGKLNATQYRDDILEHVTLPYLQNLDPKAILQDDNARPHRSWILDDFLQTHGVERMQWPVVSPDLNPIKNLWDQLGRAACRRVTSQTTLA